MPNFFSQIIAKIISSAISFVYLFTGFKSGLDGEVIEKPENFTPILRFAVCSDVHLDGDEEQINAIRLKNLKSTENSVLFSIIFSSFDLAF